MARLFGPREDAKTLQHELAHGLYATNMAYRRAAQQSLKALPAERVDASRRVLLELGRDAERRSKYV